MSYFQTQCPQCGAIYMTGMVGTTMVGSHRSHVCPVTIPHGCVVNNFSSSHCSRGTKSCVVKHVEEKGKGNGNAE